MTPLERATRWFLVTVCSTAAVGCSGTNDASLDPSMGPIEPETNTDAGAASVDAAAKVAADSGKPEEAGVPGSPICDEGLAIFGSSNKYTVTTSDEMFAKVKSLGSTDNVWIIDQKACRTYFKVNKYVLRIESLYGASDAFPDQVEAARIVGRKESATGAWTFDLAKQSRSLCVVGTSQDEFRMGGFPYGISLGALVVGSTQTYGGAISDALLAETHPGDATRAMSIWKRFHEGQSWQADIFVMGHSAGSVPAEDVVVSNGGDAYLYGTPKYKDLSLEKSGKGSATGLAYTMHIANHSGDPVSGSYQCSAAYYSCKQFLHRTGAKDPDAASAACAIGKDPYCAIVLKNLDDSSAWAAHDYSDMTVKDPG